MTRNGKTAYCGTLGSFAERAAARIFPESTLVGCASFAEAYEKVRTGECDRAVLPLENSYAGEVSAVVDLLYRGDLYVTDIYDMRVVQNLLAPRGASIESIRRVVSHPQALAQCEKYISAHGYTAIPAENTAFAAKYVAETGDVTLAAIAGEECASLYGLEILESDIAATENNATRFAVVEKDAPSPRTGENCVLFFSLNDTSGALAKALSVIATHGYNLKSLHSHPLHAGAWQYYFYIEAEGNLREEDAALLEALRPLCNTIKIAGYYLPRLHI